MKNNQLILYKRFDERIIYTDENLILYDKNSTVLCIEELIKDNLLIIDPSYNGIYFCKLKSITPLCKYKIKNGGFVKEYYDKRNDFKNKFYMYSTLFVIFIYTVVEVLTYLHIKIK